MSSDSHLVTYYEIATSLAARIGAGHAQEILTRSDFDPSIRICLREPLGSQVKTRMRFGLAEVGEDGFRDVETNDPTQNRGAWGKTLPVACNIFRFLGGLSMRVELLFGEACPSPLWVEVELSSYSMTCVDEVQVTDVFAGPCEQEPLTKAYLRFAGTDEELETILRKLAELPTEE